MQPACCPSDGSALARHCPGHLCGLRAPRVCAAPEKTEQPPPLWPVTEAGADFFAIFSPPGVNIPRFAAVSQQCGRENARPACRQKGGRQENFFTEVNIAENLLLKEKQRGKRLPTASGARMRGQPGSRAPRAGGTQSRTGDAPVSRTRKSGPLPAPPRRRTEPGFRVSFE